MSIFICRWGGRSSEGHRDLPEATLPIRRGSDSTWTRPAVGKDKSSSCEQVTVVGQGPCSCTWRGACESF